MLSNTYLTKIFVVAFVFIVLPLGLFVCKNLYDKMKNEEHRDKGKVIQTIIKNHCLIQMIAWPTLCLFSLLIFLNNDTFHFIDPFKTIFVIKTRPNSMLFPILSLWSNSNIQMLISFLSSLSFFSFFDSGHSKVFVPHV